jgi:hypothetical protein
MPCRSEMAIREEGPCCVAFRKANVVLVKCANSRVVFGLCAAWWCKSTSRRSRRERTAAATGVGHLPSVHNYRFAGDLGRYRRSWLERSFLFRSHFYTGTQDRKDRRQEGAWKFFHLH